MTRVAFFLLAIAAGCSTAVRSVGSPEVSAAIAVEGARAVIAARRVKPTPVVPAGVCPRCEGRGFIGDQSAIRVTCPACKGTGKTTVPTKSAPCPTGKCPVQR